MNGENGVRTIRVGGQNGLLHVHIVAGGIDGETRGVDVLKDVFVTHFEHSDLGQVQWGPREDRGRRVKFGSVEGIEEVHPSGSGGATSTVLFDLKEPILRTVKKAEAVDGSPVDVEAAGDVGDAVVGKDGEAGGQGSESSRDGATPGVAD